MKLVGRHVAFWVSAPRDVVPEQTELVAPVVLVTSRVELHKGFEEDEDLPSFPVGSKTGRIITWPLLQRAAETIAIGNRKRFVKVP